MKERGDRGKVVVDGERFSERGDLARGVWSWGSGLDGGFLMQVAMSSSGRERERERSGMFEVSESGERGKMKGIREGAAVSIKEIMATATFDLSFSCS